MNITEFQSTHPCGVRQMVFLDNAGRIGFNPRTPAGCDIMSASGLMQNVRFQSTHPCGVRLKKALRYALTISVSIHAPLRGATGSHYREVQTNQSFNPRTPAGCDNKYHDRQRQR